MVKQTIKSQAILPRIDGIQHDLAKLRELSAMGLQRMSEETNFVLAQFYLRRALEGVFHIGSHILARLPGCRAVEYKDIARKLGEAGIIEQDIAQNKLKSMAGYRNRLTHFYADVKPEEIYEILKNHLNDFEKYLEMIKKVLGNLDKYNLEIE